MREQPGEYPRVSIGADAWVGDRALVTADVGRKSIVGGGSVVTRPVPELAIVFGNPAAIRGYRGGADLPASDKSSPSSLPPENSDWQAC
jgi:acetyltransferase-like isoleucine patch superfamily enzyme